MTNPVHRAQVEISFLSPVRDPLRYMFCFNYLIVLLHLIMLIEAKLIHAGSAARTSGTSATAGANTTPLRWDRQTIQFSVNAWV